MFTTNPSFLSVDKFREQTLNALLCCAVGDALGAGIEIWDLKDIIDKFGSNRDLEYTRFTRPGSSPTNGQPGDVTDDTSMTACVMAALTKAMHKYLEDDSSTFNASDFQQLALTTMFQAFLFWIQSQTTYSGISGQPCAKFITDREWPLLCAFYDTFGAGDGTMNILLQGKMGTLENLPEKIAFNNKPEKTRYVDTCGALMRIMPVGLICGIITSLDAFEFGCRAAALTHGDAASYLASGIMVEIISERIRSEKSIAEIIDTIKTQLVARKTFARSPQEFAGYEVCIDVISAAIEHLNDTGVYPIDIMDKIGERCGGKLFNTPPVFGQALFVALAAERHFYNADTALKLATIHSGDSDSVAAIAGGLIGTVGGKNAQLSDKLLQGLNSKYRLALNQLGLEFASAAKLFAEKLTLVQQHARNVSFD